VFDLLNYMGLLRCKVTTVLAFLVPLVVILIQYYHERDFKNTINKRN
jgi:hypothetical protein